MDAAAFAGLAPRWEFRQHWNFGQVPPRLAVNDYMKALLICAKGDGEISAPEREWVVGYSAVMGGGQELAEELAVYQGEDDLAELVSREPSVNASRGALVYDALRACDADGELAPGELESIRRMAHALGVPEVVDPLHEAYRAEKENRRYRLALTHPAGTPL
jgi:tellurite resistance protein